MLEDLEPLEVAISKLKKKLLDPKLINEKKVKKKLSFLIKRVDIIKKTTSRRNEIDRANKNTIKSHNIKTSIVHKRKPIDGLAAKVTDSRNCKIKK
jgi:hypothetical protein